MGTAQETQRLRYSNRRIKYHCLLRGSPETHKYTLTFMWLYIVLNYL